MDVVEMVGLLGEQLNDPDEERYDAFLKLAYLNAAQQALMPSIPVRELANLAVYDHRLQANSTNEQELPTDFYREIDVESVKSVSDGRIWRIKSPETPRSFPHDGCRFEPIIRRTEGKLRVFGRKFDEDVYLDYYRLPRRMCIDGVAEGFIDSAGSVVHGGSGTVTTIYPTDVWRGGNVSSELPETVHMLIVEHARIAILQADQEIKEVATT